MVIFKLFEKQQIPSPGPIQLIFDHYNGLFSRIVPNYEHPEKQMFTKFTFFEFYTFLKDFAFLANTPFFQVHCDHAWHRVVNPVSFRGGEINHVDEFIDILRDFFKFQDKVFIKRFLGRTTAETEAKLIDAHRDLHLGLFNEYENIFDLLKRRRIAVMEGRPLKLGIVAATGVERQAAAAATSARPVSAAASAKTASTTDHRVFLRSLLFDSEFLLISNGGGRFLELRPQKEYRLDLLNTGVSTIQVDIELGMDAPLEVQWSPLKRVNPGLSLPIRIVTSGAAPGDSAHSCWSGELKFTCFSRDGREIVIVPVRVVDQRTGSGDGGRGVGRIRPGSAGLSKFAKTMELKCKDGKIDTIKCSYSNRN